MNNIEYQRKNKNPFLLNTQNKYKQCHFNKSSFFSLNSFKRCLISCNSSFCFSVVRSLILSIMASYFRHHLKFPLHCKPISTIMRFTNSTTTRQYLLLRSTLVFLISLNLWCLLCSLQQTVYCCLDDMTLRCNAGEIIFSWAFKPFMFIWSYRIQYTVIQSFLFEDFQQVRTCSH